MLTIFSTPKPFQGHLRVIQRNAIQSWKLLHPDFEVVLFGPEDGAGETAREFGIRHVAEVRSNEHGTKYLADFFDRAQEISRHDLVCYVNCDIVLTSDFREALEQVAHRWKRFLMVGRRWDLDIAGPLDFAAPDWGARLRERSLREGRQRPSQWIDYFVFSRGLYHGNIPGFVIGRPGWDNWLIWKARALKVPVVDVSQLVIAVHQNHDYSHHPDGEKGVWQGEEAQENYRLLEGWRQFRTIENATHFLTARGARWNYHHWLALARWEAKGAASRTWFGLLDLTRPARHLVGWRQKSVSGSATGSLGDKTAD